MEDRKRLAYSIIRFLHEQVKHGGLSSDAQESLEASIQCLETAFEVTVEDRHLAVSQTLPEIFEAAIEREEMPNIRRNSEPFIDRETPEAERFKRKGNEQMKKENFEEAVSFYGKAIELNPTNAVYFCNRAAAYSKIGDYAGAMRDCERAIGIDPYYSKAYGRMGLALLSLNKYKEAVGYYKKALELDPDNDMYKTNFKLAQKKMKETSDVTENTGGIDLAGLLNNPSLRNMASNLMNNPQVQQVVSGVASSIQNHSGAARGNRSPNNLSNLIQAGQHFAQQLQQQNPELIEQLKNQIRSRSSRTSSDDQKE
ncbi:small glutamine-rich tetratricopeptide repeat-containing protein alpha-like [Gracilinanus agilis]|uniref:small glutamine-rich tetratricopeptide repeat-containing protein alpha-like n=1 Tax=Gracilinanus agilis TaxID=191870 RepID=UPI001CFCBBE5|nr:small glutamine-rich tetratricopeptide repeat-containing protein alpha-like [Gracilinanus agilis]